MDAASFTAGSAPDAKPEKARRVRLQRSGPAGCAGETSFKVIFPRVCARHGVAYGSRFRFSVPPAMRLPADLAFGARKKCFGRRISYAINVYPFILFGF